MKRLMLLAGGATVVLTAGTVVAVSGVNAATPSRTFTLHGHALQQKELGKSHEVEADVLKSAGKRVGYATESCDFGGQGDKCSVTLALKDGVLYGHYTFPITSGTAASTATGKITGGLAGWSGVAGTIKAVATTKRVTYTIVVS